MPKTQYKALKLEYVNKIVRKCGYIDQSKPAAKAMQKEFAKLKIPTLIILNNHMKGR